MALAAHSPRVPSPSSRFIEQRPRRQSFSESNALDLFAHPPHHTKSSARAGSMSPPPSRENMCSFADAAYSYRVYILDDLLAEPQEVVHDWHRGLLYISQRYRQGNSFAPIESSREILVFDINSREIVSAIDINPHQAPHGMELDENCTFLSAHVDDGAIWVDPQYQTISSFAPLSSPAGSGSQHSSPQAMPLVPAQRTSDDFIAEVDLRSGRMRQRVNVPESETPTDGRFVAFSAPAIRFASRAPSSGLPVINVADDPVIDAIKAKFNVRTIYVTSRNIMLV